LLVGVVTADLLTTNALLQPRDFPPVDLDAEASHEKIVADLPPLPCHDVILGGMELCDMLVNPIGSCGNERRFLALALLLGENARADQRPQRLVVVLRGRFHDGDIVGLQLAAQLRRHGDADCAATEN